MSLNGKGLLRSLYLSSEVLLDITQIDTAYLVVVVVFVLVLVFVCVLVLVFQMSLDDMDLLESLQLASEALLGITQIDHPLSLFGQPTPTTLIYLF